MERIIIMAKDEVGVLADITRVLAEANINLENIHTQVNGEQGNIIISADESDRALGLLTAAGYTALTDDAMLLRLKDEPGALARVSQRFSETGINIQSLHILNRQAGYATVALSTAPEDRALAETLLDRDSIV